MPYNPLAHVSTGELATAALHNTLLDNVAGVVDGTIVTKQVHTGAIVMTARSTAPTGYLMCNGAAVSRTTYADLFAAIGTTYGVGDNFSTFNVPNLAQRFPLGKAASGTGAVLGATGGEIDHAHGNPAHAHTYSQVPNHTHPITDPGHVHPNTSIRIGGAGSDNPQGIGSAGQINALNSGSATTGITTTSNPVGGVASATTDISGQTATDTRNPPFLTVNFVIKT